MAKRYQFELVLGAVLLALWLAIWLWQNPGIGERLDAPDVARYMAALEQLPIPPEERDATLRRARNWMETDDGRPVYMLNLMRFYPELHHYPGSLNFQGTPQESNAIYENAVIPLLLKVGGYPLYAGRTQGRNLFEHRADLDDWSRVLVVRYPSRRAFLDLLCSPVYREIAPYKLMALLLVLTPGSIEMAIPELPWLTGALLLIVFLAVGWRRAARRARAA